MKANGWLIYSQEDANRNASYIDWFIFECRRQELNLELVIREELEIGIFNNKIVIQYSNNLLQKLPVFAVVRIMDPLLNLHLEKAGMQVFNSAEVSRIANDKGLAHLHAAELEIPMVDTIFAKKGSLTEHPSIPFPLVIKQTDGRSGKQVMKVSSKQQWNSARKVFSNSDTVIQSANVLPGKDLRVFVIGRDIIAAVLRENQTDFRANITLGGQSRLYLLSSKETTLINKLIQAFDFGLVGIDFLFDSDGNLLFNEIEDCVGSRSLSKVSSINLLELYVSFIKTALKDGCYIN